MRYLGRDLASDEVVVLTTLSTDSTATVRFKKYRRRQREIQAEVAERLKHPNVLAVVAVSDEDEPEYIAHEYVHGGLSRCITSVSQKHVYRFTKRYLSPSRSRTRSTALTASASCILTSNRDISW
jgi:hypothetical protein